MNTKPQGTKEEIMKALDIAEWEYDYWYGDLGKPTPPRPGVSEVYAAYDKGRERQIRSGAGRWEHSMLCAARDEALKYDNPAALAEAVATGDLLPKDDQCWTESGWCIRASRRIRYKAEELGLEKFRGH